MLPQIKQFYHRSSPKKATKSYWHNLHGCSQSLAIAYQALQNPHNPLLVITPDILSQARLAQELSFYLGQAANIPIHLLADWETLPYDHFSPHEDIISQRLLTLAQIPHLASGIIVVAATTLMQRLPPPDYVANNSFILAVNDAIDIEKLRHRLINQGYISVTKVMARGEFASRGSIIDIFPVGSNNPFRIDVFDTKVDSIRIFNPNTQISTTKIDQIHLLPAKEYPLNDQAISRFRRAWRANFTVEVLDCPIYQSVMRHENHPGIEYYLPLFFEQTATLFDYLPANCIIMKTSDDQAVMANFWHEINHRYEQLRHNRTHPLLAPTELFIPIDNIFALQNQLPQILLKPHANAINFHTSAIGDVAINHKAQLPLEKLQRLWHNTISDNSGSSMLLITESAGRREVMLESLKSINLSPVVVESWSDFLELASNNNPVIARGASAPWQSSNKGFLDPDAAKNAARDDEPNEQPKNCLAITVAPLEQSVCLSSLESAAKLFIITEAQIFGANKVSLGQARANKIRGYDPETIIRDLTELHLGDPVVHIDHGIGRYLGLQQLTIDGLNNEFLVLEYANAAKLYVPVASINLINRYTGMAAQQVALSHLGSKQWEKTKQEAQQKTRDAAVEILEIHARRQAVRGFSFTQPDTDYQKFAASFDFVETPDQTKAILDVIHDMTSDKPMDRLICGDVGFGKTEIAMRAAFIAASNSKQVVVLAPTTLLAQQHFTNFQDRFADWPINVALFTRFKAAKEQKIILAELNSSKIDIVIGTHKLLQDEVKFNNLGLLIIDEEHRFGVKHKEQIKKLTPNIDILTLTATPIPRTLNMAFASIRDFSIISTPPAKRLAIKTFVSTANDHLLKEAIMREILRGGQVYFLHNDVATMAKTANYLQQLVPTARIAMAHGQMRKQELERVMGDFYRLKINILICSTIIESGIDVPTANTIIIDRADCFGLAQLHQLRGRVGRSHHQAYAYLITPPEGALTADAKKRLEAITSLEDLGSGFILATHDLEIRGAGELLGEEQSGAIQNIGFNLYMEMLEQAIQTLKDGKNLDLAATNKHLTEVDLPLPALIPDTYVPDMNLRLVLYKRIAGVKTCAELNELLVEMIDRFGQLPIATHNLFKINQVRLQAQSLGIVKIIAGASGKGSITFGTQPNIEPSLIIQLVQQNPSIYKFKGSQQIEFSLAPTEVVLDFINDLLNKFTHSG